MMKLNASRFIRPWVAIACLMLLSLVSAGNAANLVYHATNPTYVPNEYIIRAVAGSSIQAVTASVTQLGGVLTRVLPLPDTYLVRMGKIGGGNTRVSAHAVRSPWVIKSFSPNLIYHADATPDDQYWKLDKLWGLKTINMPLAWNTEKGSSLYTVAVVDSGVADHPDLLGRITAGYDFVDNDADPSNDLDGHGTHVSGTIAAQGNNQIGVVGVCWDGVMIMPVRVLDEFGGGTTDAIIRGLEFARVNRADVVNMSLGAPYGLHDPNLQAKVQELDDEGIIICASAGNSGDTFNPGVGEPASYPECIAVGAVGPNDAIAPYSSYGPSNEVDIAAPGGYLGPLGLNTDDGIWSTFVTWAGTIPPTPNPTPTFVYEALQGTSMACPHVSGAAAILLSAGIPKAEVRSRLESSARKISGMDQKKFGSGILDVNAALTGTIFIDKPIKGSVVSACPDIKISIRGIDPDTNLISIFVDSADPNGPGGPSTPVNRKFVLRPGSPYLNEAKTTLSFNWCNTPSLVDPNVPNSPLDPGFYFIYVTARNAVGDDQVYDWGTFTVAAKLVPAGQHMFAFPYAPTFNPDGTIAANLLPSDILIDAATAQPVDFRAQTPDRARLIRWSAPHSVYFSYVTGLVDPASNTPRFDDKAWLNPLIRMLLPDGTVQPVPTASGFLPLDPRANLQFPAGTGFWLILQKDAVINSALTELSAPQGLSIYMYKGWNMIGNPYAHEVPLTAMQLSYQGETRTLDEDQVNARPWVDPNFYGYKSGSGYELVPAEKRLFEPFSGYWIRALVGGISPQDSLVMTVQ